MSASFPTGSRLQGVRRRACVREWGSLGSFAASEVLAESLDPDATTGVPAVLRSASRSSSPMRRQPRWLRTSREHERLAEELEQLGITSRRCVPLLAHGRTFGAIALLARARLWPFDAGWERWLAQSRGAPPELLAGWDRP